MAEQGKVSGFRLPKEVLDKLDELQDKGVIKNRTEGVIKGIEMLYENHDTATGNITDIIQWVTKTKQVALDWPLFPLNTMFPIFYKGGDRVIVTKLGPEHVEFVRDVNGHRLIINARRDDEGLGAAKKRDYMFAVRDRDMSLEELEKAQKKMEESKQHNKKQEGQK